MYQHPCQRNTYPDADDEFREDLSEYHVADGIFPRERDRDEDRAIQHNPHQRADRTPCQQRMRVLFQKRENPAVEDAAHQKRRETRDHYARCGEADCAEGFVVQEVLRGRHDGGEREQADEEGVEEQGGDDGTTRGAESVELRDQIPHDECEGIKDDGGGEGEGEDVDRLHRHQVGGEDEEGEGIHGWSRVCTMYGHGSSRVR